MTLQEYVTTCRAKSFRMGTHDCAQFAAQWVALCGGPQLRAGYRYRSMRTGIAALQRDGYADHIDYFAAHLDEVHPVRAREGDIAVIDSGDGPALAICGGEMVLALGQAGLAALPRAAMLRAFRCPK